MFFLPSVFPYVSGPHWALVSWLGPTPSEPPLPLQPYRSVCPTALWNLRRPEIQTTSIKGHSENTKAIVHQSYPLIHIIRFYTGNSVCHAAILTCSTSCCLWRACSSVARWCVSDRWSVWRAAEEEASTWLFSCSPKACSCWRDCCTDAWSPRHACNSKVTREMQVRDRAVECLMFREVRECHGMYTKSKGTRT